MRKILVVASVIAGLSASSPAWAAQPNPIREYGKQAIIKPNPIREYRFGGAHRAQ